MASSAKGRGLSARLISLKWVGKPTTRVAVVPSAVPTHASACSGTVRYQSACSCLGITRTTVTAATPTVWVSVVGSTSVTVTSQTSTTTTQVATTLTTTTAQATSTSQIQACFASNNYGFMYTGGHTDRPPLNPNAGATFPSFPIPDQEGCCQKCFTTANCFIYYIDGGQCNLYVWDNSVASGTNVCPAGVGLEYTNSGSLFGIGPCAVPARYSNIALLLQMVYSWNRWLFFFL